MNLGCKTEFSNGNPTNFESKILDGIKIHTIREDKTNRWEKGTKIHFATGVRTKKYKCFKIGECVSTQKIEFKWHNHNKGLVSESWSVQVFIDGNDVTTETEIIDELVKNDGFDNRKDFFEWQGWHKKNFKGKIIHWTNKRY
ncbi:MAG TPA: hypothetical protein PLD56_12610 [Chitinophagales bacterium]|nr:hypothetical protein [Chitinophagales bacterium]